LAPKRINIHMFYKLFKRKTELERLQKQHSALLEKAFKASKVNRTLSDELMAQAYTVEQKIFKETSK
jgi:hypothetical protein